MPRTRTATAALPDSRWLVTLDQAGAIAGVSRWSIRRRIADGTLVGYRVGPRLLRVDSREVRARMVQPIPVAGGGAA